MLDGVLGVLDGVLGEAGVVGESPLLDVVAAGAVAAVLKDEEDPVRLSVL